MEEIFKQYGGPIITVMVIVAIIAIVTLLLSTGDDGVISNAFKELIGKFQGRGEDAIEGIDTSTIIFSHFLG